MSENEGEIMYGVREYAEEMPVKLKQSDISLDRRWVIEARNEGGFNGVEVDLLDLLKWLRENRIDLLMTSEEEERARHYRVRGQLKQAKTHLLKPVKVTGFNDGFDALDRHTSYHRQLQTFRLRPFDNDPDDINNYGTNELNPDEGDKG